MGIFVVGWTIFMANSMHKLVDVNTLQILLIFFFQRLLLHISILNIGSIAASGLRVECLDGKTSLRPLFNMTSKFECKWV